MTSNPTPAYIFDLDNTLYPSASVGDAVFAKVIALIDESGEAGDRLPEIKEKMNHTAFQKLAEEYDFSDELVETCTEELKRTTCDVPAFTFPDYQEVRSLPADKYLVTAGFTGLQQSKVDRLGIGKDFKGIYIVDAELTDKTKKDIFTQIIDENNYDPGKVLVIGDDPESEIRAALELGIKCVLYDRVGRFPDYDEVPRITDMARLPSLG